MKLSLLSSTLVVTLCFVFTYASILIKKDDPELSVHERLLQRKPRCLKDLIFGRSTSPPPPTHVIISPPPTGLCNGQPCYLPTGFQGTPQYGGYLPTGFQGTPQYGGYLPTGYQGTPQYGGYLPTGFQGPAQYGGYLPTGFQGPPQHGGYLPTGFQGPPQHGGYLPRGSQEPPHRGGYLPGCNGNCKPQGDEDEVETLDRKRRDLLYIPSGKIRTHTPSTALCFGQPCNVLGGFQRPEYQRNRTPIEIQPDEEFRIQSSAKFDDEGFSDFTPETNTREMLYGTKSFGPNIMEDDKVQLWLNTIYGNQRMETKK